MVISLNPNHDTTITSVIMSTDAEGGHHFFLLFIPCFVWAVIYTKLAFSVSVICTKLAKSIFIIYSVCVYDFSW